jgi:hypothetical protein
MGLLDEAIREHLDLKRRRGADPTEVAREEREALAPVFSDEDLAEAADAQDLDHQEDRPAATAAEAVPAGEVQDGDARLADVSSAGQETAELDMQAVMEEDPDAADGGSPEAPMADGPARVANAGDTTQDSLEWEVPGDGEDQAGSEDVAGQERLSSE